MRWVVSAICTGGALLLIAASMAMNWSFWTGQGADPSTANILGGVSIGVDIFKAMLPLVIAGAWAGRHRLGALVGILFFCGCLAFSFFSAIGFAAGSRGTVTGNRETVALRYQGAESELKDANGRLVALGTVRPQGVIEEALEKARQDRSWASSRECKDATLEASRAFCKGVGDLRVELASSIESEHLRERATSLKREMDRLLEAGARLEQDPQASLLARLSGLQLGRVQTLLVVLFALLVELGAAFGLFLALLPLGAVRSPARTINLPRTAFPAPATIAVADNRKPKRFVRSAGGQLLIE